MPEQPRSIIAGAEADQPDVAAATTAAAEAFATYRATTPDQRGDFLDAVAAEIEADKDAIVEAAVAESNLPEGRITGEVGRTTGQLRMFADVVRRGDHLGVRIDPALPDRAPLPRADIRQRQVALGPGRGLRRQQLPARLLHRRRRHRLGAGRRLPGRGQGPPGPPAHRTTSSRAPSRVPSSRPACTPAPSPSSSGRAASSSARSWSRTRGSRRSASPAPAAAGSRSSLRPRPAPSRSRSTPRCPRSTPSSSSPARSPRATSRRSPRRTSARSPWVPASSAPTPVCSSCRPARPATRSSTLLAPPWPRPTGATMLTPGIAEAYATGTASAPRRRRRPRRGPGQRRR